MYSLKQSSKDHHIRRTFAFMSQRKANNWYSSGRFKYLMDVYI